MDKTDSILEPPVSDYSVTNFDNPSESLISNDWNENIDDVASREYSDPGDLVKPYKHEVKQVTIQLPGKRHFRVSLRSLNIFLSFMTVIFTVAMNVSLPIFSDAAANSGSDAYFVLFSCTLMFPPFFFILLVISKLIDPSVSFRLKAPMKLVVIAGILNSLNGLFLVYASNSSRTPPALQAILSTSIIPFTVISRYVILKKGVGIKRLVCTGVVMVGLFISMEPTIFDIDHTNESSGSGEKKESRLGRILWPMTFLLGFLPLAIMNVVLEKVRDKETSSALVNAWLNVYCLTSVVTLFWTDFIPGFGSVSSPALFWENLSQGFKCQYGADRLCSDLIGRSWLFIVSYVMTYLFNFLLIRFADGAVYLVVVQALNTPLAALFWTFFKLDNSSFYWNPVFDLATAFTLGGLAIMTPAVVMYRYFGDLEAEEEQQKEQKEQYIQVNT
ncbi:uncharacterized protein LOC144451867 [Glandiceps talaboti]